MWNEMATGPSSRVASNASWSKGRPVWLTANGRSVNERSRSHSAVSSSTLRTAVPTLPNPPAFDTAAASSTSSHGPNGARMIGTSIPSRSQMLDRIDDQ